MITEAHHKNCLDTLQKLIQINTTNPPGNEILAAKFIQTLFEAHQIDYQILESAPGRANIVARLKGNGKEKPFLLSSHLDVVPAEKEFWDVDPFAGVIKDGCIWGRGAVDMKNMTAMCLEIFIKLKKENATLKRDVIFVAVADEEAGSTYGSKWLVENHPDLIRTEYALNEVGGFNLEIGERTYYPIGVAEKGVCWFTIKAKGKPGHGSMPHDEQALGKLAKAALILSENNLPFHLSDVVKDFISEVASAQGVFKKIGLGILKNKSLNSVVLKKLTKDRKTANRLWALFHNTAVPTMVSAGQKVNVIPGEATLTIDGRILPGSSVAKFLNEVKAQIGDGFEFEILHAQEPSEIPNYNNDFFKSLKTVLENKDPGAKAVPFLVPGFSDSHHYHKLGIQSFGFAPAKLPKGMNLAELYHAHNERLPLKALRFGLEAMWDVVKLWCVE